jgi:hypothetical protein
MQLARAASACSWIAGYYCCPSTAIDSHRQPPWKKVQCGPDGYLCSTSQHAPQAVKAPGPIRVVAQQAQSLQCDVISCAVYDCFLLQSCERLIIQKRIMCATQFMEVVGIENSARCFSQRRNVRPCVCWPRRLLCKPCLGHQMLRRQLSQWKCRRKCDGSLTGGLLPSLMRHSGGWGPWGRRLPFCFVFLEIGVSPVFHILTHFYR